MNIQQVKENTGEWLMCNLPQYPGLCGAHFVGSINRMSDDAFFPAYNDVDFHLIFKEGSPALASHGPLGRILETEYKGLILEVGYKPLSDYQTPELVLANPEIAHHLTVDSLLYDPEGWLHDLQAPVRREYARRKWVLARVDFERKGLERWQEIRAFALAADNDGLTDFGLLGFHLTYLVALMCVATLQSPSSGTARMRDILVEHDRLDLYDEAMDILGFNNFQVDQLEVLLQEGIEAFDLAVQVIRSPNPFQHKLHAHQRGYFVDKVRALIDTGRVEAAAGWLLAFSNSSIDVILADGPDEVKPKFAARKQAMRTLLGMNDAEVRNERYLRMLALDEQLFKLAEAMIQANPAIFD